MVSNETFLALVAVGGLTIEVIRLYLENRKMKSEKKDLQDKVDAQKEAIAVLHDMAKAQKQAVKVQKDQLYLNVGIAYLKAVNILDKDGRLTESLM